MASNLSERGASTAKLFKSAWKSVPRGTYSPENPSGLICFGTAENALVTEELLQFSKKNLELKAQDFRIQYTEGSGPGVQFPRALATHLNEYLQPHRPIQAEEIQVTSAATAINDILGWALADPGEGILSSRPIYGRFELDFESKAQVKIVYADTDAGNCFDENVVERFEEALVRSNAEGVKIKGLLIVNPHNPLGRCYPRKTIVNLMAFCQRHGIHLISDEIYACSVFDSGEPNTVPFTSALSIDPTDLIDSSLLHVNYGLTKDFGASGLALGATITRNLAFRSAIDRALAFHTPSGVSLAIGAAMLSDREWCHAFIRNAREKLAAAYAHVTKGLREMGVEYLRGNNAGFFVYADFSPWLPQEWEGEENAEFALAKKFMDAGVFLHPREEHAPRPGWFRLVYTQDPGTVTEGLRRIKTVIS